MWDFKIEELRPASVTVATFTYARSIVICAVILLFAVGTGGVLLYLWPGYRNEMAVKPIALCFLFVFLVGIASLYVLAANTLFRIWRPQKLTRITFPLSFFLAVSFVASVMFVLALNYIFRGAYSWGITKTLLFLLVVGGTAHTKLFSSLPQLSGVRVDDCALRLGWRASTVVPFEKIEAIRAEVLSKEEEIRLVRIILISSAPDVDGICLDNAEAARMFSFLITVLMIARERGIPIQYEPCSSALMDANKKIDLRKKGTAAFFAGDNENE